MWVHVVMLLRSTIGDSMPTQCVYVTTHKGICPNSVLTHIVVSKQVYMNVLVNASCHNALRSFEDANMVG